MNFKQITLSAAAAAALLISAAAAQATPIIFETPVAPTDNLTIKFTNFEAFVNSSGALTTSLAVNDQNFGILAIQSIFDNTTGLPAFSPGVLGQQIFGVFSGIKVTSVIPAGGGGFDTTNSGGVFNLYVLPGTVLFNQNTVTSQGTGGYAAAGCALNTQCYNLITNTGESSDLNVALVPGIIPGDTTTTLAAHTNTNTVPTSGNASGLGDVVGGNDASQVGTVLSFADNFCVPSKTSTTCTISGNWPINSNDPVHLSTVAVPEPGSLAIFGTALFGLGFLGFLRNRNRT